MYKLLIVEDEKGTREGLMDCIDWEQYGIELVAGLRNGEEALAYIENNPVDIVLTDVVMPVVDGIELIQEIRDRQYDIKTIIISGHGDIPYLKSAFKLDAIDYIFKPVDLEELDKVMKKVVKICDKEMKQQEKLKNLQKKLTESIPLLQERFFRRLIEGTLIDREEIIKRIDFLNLDIKVDEHYFIINVNINTADKDDTKENQQIEEREVKELLIINEVNKLYKGQYTIYNISNNQELVLIFNTKKSITYQKSFNVADNIHRVINDVIGQKATIGISDQVDYLGDLYQCYQQSQLALKNKFFLGTGEVIHIEDIESREKSNFFYPERQYEEILDAARSGENEKIENLIENFFVNIRKQNLSIEFIKILAVELVILTLKELPETNQESQDITWQEILGFNTLKKIKSWLKMKIKKIAVNINKQQSNKTRYLIKKIKKTIRENYDEDISLKTLADDFYLTSNYICLLFKKETGETFNSYLTDVRIEKAKELLKDPVLRIYQIAEKVGYSDSDYFTRLFKKNTGVTPSEYRKRL